MADMTYSRKEAVAQLEQIRDRAIEMVKAEYDRVVADLQQSHVLRQQMSELSLQLKAAGVLAIDVTNNYQPTDCVELRLGNGNFYQAHLLRKLKVGKYRAVIIFTPEEDEEKTGSSTG